MIIEFPESKSRRWTGPYLGDYLGDLWKTFNIDLDREEGKVSLSRRMIKVADTTDTNRDTLGAITAFLRSNASGRDLYWALSRSASLYRADSNPTDSWDVDTLVNSPSDGRDMWIHENDSKDTGAAPAGKNRMIVTRDTDIAVLNDTGDNVWNASWWVTTKGQTGLRPGVPHPGEYFPYQRISLIGDGNFIHTIDKLKAISYSRLVLPIYLQIEYIFTTSKRVWILCSHKFSGNGAIVEWDGFSQTYNEIHNLYSQSPISGVNYEEIPIVLNHKGMILEYTGSGFTQMVRNGQKVALPMAEEEGFSFSTSGAPRTSPGRCMTVGGDGLIYANLGEGVLSDQTLGLTTRQLAGIWCLNPKTGRIYNKYSLGQWGSHFGYQRMSSNGAIFPLDPALFTSKVFLIGGQYDKSASVTALSAIWSLENINSVTANRGHFITSFIPTEKIKDFWDFLYLHFKAFQTATDKIIVKAQGVRPLLLSTGFPLDAAATWASTTTFTTTLSASDDIVKIGDEIEVLYGDNAGVTAHIIDISGAQGILQTFTIDETVVASTATFGVRFERWKKLGVISIQNIYHQLINIGIDSSFIRFKVELRGPYREMQIANLLVVPKNSIEIKS